jgi:hypothetical protein
MRITVINGPQFTFKRGHEFKRNLELITVSCDNKTSVTIVAPQGAVIEHTVHLPDSDSAPYTVK